MHFLYKLASESEQEINPAYRAATLAGGLAGTAMGDYLQRKSVLIADRHHRTQHLKGTQLKDINLRLKDMEDIAGAHGYKRVSYTDVWEDALGKGRPKVFFNPRYGDPDGAHASFTTDFRKPDEREIVLGDTRPGRSRATLAHEFGHTQQNRKLLTASHLMRRGFNPAMTGLALSQSLLAGHVSDDVSNKVEGGFAAAATASMLPTLGTEIDASWRGSKALGTAPTRFGRFKQRIKAFHGVPSYLTMTMIPGVTYLGGRMLRGLTPHTNDEG